MGALAFFGIAGAVLYAGVFKTAPSFNTGEILIENALPFGENLDFSRVAKKSTGNTVNFPKLSPNSEVGVELGSLFKSIPSGTVQQGTTNFNR